ncbi:MAG: hypothetical protein IKL32_05775, partial [Alphaproteobacteria bacterium]|nr:hypothetical protein [Alphaproteobacteria bacterium]
EDYTEDNLIVFDVGIQKKIPQQVCQTIFDTFYTQAFQIDINDKVANTSADCVQENTMTFYFDYGSFSPNGCKNDSDCGDGRYCDTDTGFCFWGGKPESSYIVCTTTNECCVEGGSPYTKNGADCTLSDGTIGQCNFGECSVKGCTYDENKCTGVGVYCDSPSGICEEAFPNGTTGWCRKADFLKLDVGGKTYYVSHYNMTWWNADAACKALGKSLLSVDDLVSGWNGSSTGEHTKTALLEALLSELGGHYEIWTKDLINNNCGVFLVNTDGSVFSYNRGGYGSGTFAVCQ